MPQHQTLNSKLIGAAHLQRTRCRDHQEPALTAASTMKLSVLILVGCASSLLAFSLPALVAGSSLDGLTAGLVASKAVALDELQKKQDAPAASSSATPTTTSISSANMEPVVQAANESTAEQGSLGAKSASLVHPLELPLAPVFISQAPRSDRQEILSVYNEFFTRARSHDDQQTKQDVREGVMARLQDLGFQSSSFQTSRFEFRRRPAFSYNIISVLPGRHWHTARDRIVLIGAHWDSYTQAPGVDDNGSGSTCLLEIARLISDNRCRFNHTVMLVWFDYEEQGKYGSEFFVNDYLFPLELERYQSKFIGAFIMDMVLVRDNENNTQSLPASLKGRLKEFYDEIEQERNRGDFLATWSRKLWDEPLEDAFRGAWTDLGYESRTFKAMRAELPQARLPNSEERYDWKDFFRSDHASFWFPPLISQAVRRAHNRTSLSSHTSLNAILLTDLGPWRKSYQKCYHSTCDDEHLLTDGNLAFMQQVIDTLFLTLMRVGHGQCELLEGNVKPKLSASSPTNEMPSNDSPSNVTVHSKILRSFRNNLNKINDNYSSDSNNSDKLSAIDSTNSANSHHTDSQSVNEHEREHEQQHLYQHQHQHQHFLQQHQNHHQTDSQASLGGDVRRLYKNAHNKRHI